ncbi:uncharacterized protein Aud_009642 [Aspergillus udagawae]|uniref:Heme haloperoxidase family profile domain-containing protein n=1 Tax=Aspergillus udagawae TaxID=91492 RepID=A0A8E0V464_9EURO|nr:uncharacterized protein Aud_009642 [Aspergillus udagawae]GIC93160.1 hypothetical protein Aud_009642 [Aspergillus udagawae]
MPRWRLAAISGAYPSHRAPFALSSALANHDILPRSGKHISYKQLSLVIQHAYNLAPCSPTSSLLRPISLAKGGLDRHAGPQCFECHLARCLIYTYVPHPDFPGWPLVCWRAKCTGPDIAFCPDQGVPHPDLVDNFLSHASNGKSLSLDDVVYFSGLRGAECRRTNGQYSRTWNFLHQFFGSLLLLSS